MSEILVPTSLALFSSDDDMQSNFSHMSEAEEFSRMSELAEVSDEGENSCDDIPEEADELDVDQKVDIKPWQWQGLDFTRDDLQNQEQSVDQNTTKGKSKPYVKSRTLLVQSFSC